MFTQYLIRIIIDHAYMYEEKECNMQKKASPQTDSGERKRGSETNKNAGNIHTNYFFSVTYQAKDMSSTGASASHVAGISKETSASPVIIS